MGHSGIVATLCELSRQSGFLGKAVVTGARAAALTHRRASVPAHRERGAAISMLAPHRRDRFAFGR